jgi:hypothetical protein
MSRRRNGQKPAIAIDAGQQARRVLRAEPIAHRGEALAAEEFRPAGTRRARD